MKLITSILIILFLLIGTAYSQVTGIKAFYQNGQTFLTWNNLKLQKISYKVYRSKARFREYFDFNIKNYIGTVGDSSSKNVRLSKILGKDIFFRINPNDKPLTQTKGLFVHSCKEKGNFYYAVTTVIDTQEVLDFYQKENVLAAPVSEIPSSIEPVWQIDIEKNGNKHEVYAHWTCNKSSRYYPAMSSENSIPYNFSVIKNGKNPHPSLLIYLHQHGANFLRAEGTGHDNEWVLSPDDYLQNYIQQTYWYGYSENMNLNKPGKISSHSRIIDYTARRVRWELEWLLSKTAIDRSRVYMYGSSMGGSGAVALGMTMPDRIAAVFAVMPKLDYSYIDDPNPGSIYNDGTLRRKSLALLWGSITDNFLSSDGMPVYDRLNCGYLAEIFEPVSLPFIIIFNGKNDNIVGWAEKLKFYEKMQEFRHGGLFFWDSRTHADTAGYEWAGIENPQMLYKYQLNKSYPAFSDYGHNCRIAAKEGFGLFADPGDGNPKDGDMFGSINGHLSFDQNSIIDEKKYYEIRIYPVDIKSSQCIEFAPDKLIIDITPRRLQHFEVIPGKYYTFQNVNIYGRTIQTGKIKADECGLLTVKDFIVTLGGNYLKIFSGK